MFLQLETFSADQLKTTQYVFASSWESVSKLQYSVFCLQENKTVSQNKWEFQFCLNCIQQILFAFKFWDTHNKLNITDMITSLASLWSLKKVLNVKTLLLMLVVVYKTELPFLGSCKTFTFLEKESNVFFSRHWMFNPPDWKPQ